MYFAVSQHGVLLTYELYLNYLKYDYTLCLIIFMLYYNLVARFNYNLLTCKRL